MTHPDNVSERHLRTRDPGRPRSILGALVGLVALVAMWQVAIYVFNPPPYVLPSPTEVLSAAIETYDNLLRHAAHTATEVIGGLLCGTALGVATALILWHKQALRNAVEPILVVTQSIPPVVFSPILIIWLGFGFTPKLLVVSLAVFFPVAVAGLAGLDSIDPRHLDLFRSMGASKTRRVLHLLIPMAAPQFVAGVKVAASYATFAAVVAEWMGSSVGLGIYLQRSQASYQTDQVIAATAVIALLGISMFIGVDAIARKAIRFHRPKPHTTRLTSS